MKSSAAGVLTVALGFASQSTASKLIGERSFEIGDLPGRDGGP